MRQSRTSPSVPDPWAVYTPDPAAPWDLRRVVHLHRRAGFAATWDEIGRDLKDGPGASIGRVLDGRSRLRGVPGDFAEMADRLAELALATPEPGRLKGWWVYRMLCGPDPLAERLALMWHDHFATGNGKVNDLALMRRQNETFRTLGRGPFGTLLHAMLRDPALLLWLDAPTNIKGHPNENLARELLELFTLGVGHYAEEDVRQAARALTGWRMVDDEPRLLASRHDPGPKTILVKTAPFDADGLADLLLANPATSRRLARRLCHEFLGDGVIPDGAIDSLAGGLRDHDLDIGWGAATVLRSRAFFAAENLGRRVSSPVEFVLGACRALEVLDPMPSTPVLAYWCARLGQDLFDPPNVGGWPGGRAWISTRSAIGRANFASALVEGESVGLPAPLDLRALAARHDQSRNPSFFAQLLFGLDTPTISDTDAEGCRRAVARLLASPEGQRI